MNDQVVSDPILSTCLENTNIYKDGVLKLENCDNYTQIESLAGLDSVEQIDYVDLSGVENVDTSDISRIEIVEPSANFVLYSLIFGILILIIFLGLRSYRKVSDINDNLKEL